MPPFISDASMRDFLRNQLRAVGMPEVGHNTYLDCCQISADALIDKKQGTRAKLDSTCSASAELIMSSADSSSTLAIRGVFPGCAQISFSQYE
jgi:hypothetical protein